MRTTDFVIRSKAHKYDGSRVIKKEEHGEDVNNQDQD
jgi:hypothetical protein